MDLLTIHTTTFVCMCLASLGLWIYWLRRKRAGEPLLDARLRDPVPLGLVDVIIMFAGCMVFAQVIAGGVASWLGIDVFHPEKFTLQDTSTFLICMGATQFVAVVVGSLVLWVRYGRVSAIGWQVKHIFKDTRTGLIAFLYIIPPVLLIQVGVSQLVTYEHGTLDTLRESESILPIIATWFSAVLMAPLVEEIFFRGILQGWLQRLGNTDPANFNDLILGGYFSDKPGLLNVDNGTRDSALTEDPYSHSLSAQRVADSHSGSAQDPNSIGPQVQFDSRLRWAPIFVSSGLFAATHIGQGAAPIPLFILAIGLGYLYRQTGSVVPCIVVHFLLNFYTMLWATLSITFG